MSANPRPSTINTHGNAHPAPGQRARPPIRTMHDEYQAAYVFDEGGAPRDAFAPLLNGAEGPPFVQRRGRCFREAWGAVHARIEGIVKESNSATLEGVSRFVAASQTCVDQIPSALIITGPNLASQHLLFEQLSEALPRSHPPSRFVRLKSSEAVTLKAALKKIIRDATAGAADADADADADAAGDDLTIGNALHGRRYLDYDLEALEAYVKPLQCEHVFVAFQDSEGFESSLLSDLITLL
ncbi:hypothetical protein E4U53_003418, partial [Claviceps sorghi]